MVSFSVCLLIATFALLGLGGAGTILACPFALALVRVIGVGAMSAVTLASSAVAFGVLSGAILAVRLAVASHYLSEI